MSEGLSGVVVPIVVPIVAPIVAPIAASIVVMARVLGPYGVAGWIKAAVFTTHPDALLDYEVWWLRAPTGKDWRSCRCTGGRRHTDTVVAHLEGFDDRDAALTIKGCEIGVPRSALPVADAQEIYWADLVGMRVVNREGKMLGSVIEVAAHGAHPLLEVVNGGAAIERRLIPYVPAVIDAVDIGNGQIDVDWGEDY